MRRFYALPQHFIDGRVTLDEDETRHLRDVLRLKTGDNVNVIDGQGGEFRCVISSVGKRETVLAIIESVDPPAKESPLELTLAVSILKGEKFDLLTQKAVELGVNMLVPLETARSEVRMGDREKRRLRWQKIAIGATKQCGRAMVMKVEHPMTFINFAGTAPGPVYFFSERDGSPFVSTTAGHKITAVVGPEGGWDDSEIELAKSSGFTVVTLGGRILRAETAAISVASILQHRFGDFN